MEFSNWRKSKRKKVELQVTLREKMSLNWIENSFRLEKKIIDFDYYRWSCMKNFHNSELSNREDCSVQLIFLVKKSGLSGIAWENRIEIR